MTWLNSDFMVCATHEMNPLLLVAGVFCQAKDCQCFAQKIKPIVHKTMAPEHQHSPTKAQTNLLTPSQQSLLSSNGLFSKGQ
jgi:hypothetical protein